MFVDPTTPNLADFQTFLTESVQISATALPSNSPWPSYALDQSIALTTKTRIQAAIYTVAVYNGATHLLFMITPDQPGQTYFAGKRSNTGYGLVTPSTGIIVSTFDQGTGATVTAPKWAEGLTIDQLDAYKTPWGRAWLGYLQSYGPTIWGLT